MQACMDGILKIFKNSEKVFPDYLSVSYDYDFM